ncbi:glycosyl hydrolase family 17 [Ascosphaera apis ARSEF 7405]|uniref:glucan 1,3-beta-glucosidase n=1 Tax=Ascosphaera apis ARSEF 7405 TaxID=392613 RepID=A0A168DIS5_9EURO|nr:glycosyl hydrolase family 17 [Ascosphaera apis ARSEF 7405]
MRFPTLSTLALAGVASAATGRLGFSLGVKNADGTCKGVNEFEADFDALKAAGAGVVRTYAASDCNSAALIIPAAKNKGMKVVLGVWPDVETSFNNDFEALKQHVPGNEDVVEAITVGSEALYRGDMTAHDLLNRINQVKKQFPNIQVGFADSWNKFHDGTADPLLQGGVKYFLVNGFAFWQSVAIDGAEKTYLDDMSQAMEHIQKFVPDAYIATGETGWPSDGGSSYGKSIAGTANAKKFHDKGVCAALAWGLDVFYFEAFDEPWKPASVGDNGQAANEQHWGMFTADRKPKFDVTCPKN